MPRARPLVGALGKLTSRPIKASFAEDVVRGFSEGWTALFGSMMTRPNANPSLEEIPMKLSSRSGAAIAAAAATLFLAGATMSTVSYAAGEGKCIGANSCKGMSSCKGASNACKGQNACKGKGFAEMTKEKCAAAKGTFKAG